MLSKTAIRTLILLFSITMLTRETSAQMIPTGNDMILPCSRALDEYIAPQITMKAGQCVGIVQATFYLMDGSYFCAPKTATIGQVIRIMNAYMQKNPKALHLSFPDLIRLELLSMWPCRK